MKIAIIGAGSCGTALAVVLGRNRQTHRISLWAHSADVLAALRTHRENSVYLPGMQIAASTAVTGDLGEALEDADIVLGAMPSAHARTIYTTMLPHLRAQSAAKVRKMIFVSATKGLERDSLARISEVIGEVVGELFADTARSPQEGKRDASPVRVTALSGPSFAVEMARGDPTAVAIASADTEAAACVQEAFSGPTLRLYTNDDVVGTEMGGAVKNVIAIAAGVCSGLELGANSIAALVTRGLAEMTRLAVALGARRDTLAGLAGLGDLVLTTTGPYSRNRAVGVELGKGRSLADILAGMRMVAEGVGATGAALAMGRGCGIEMPIAAQMHAVLHEGRSPREAMRELMERRLKQE